MGLDMRTWDIAKLLVENCNSPEEASEIASVLRDPASVKQIQSILEAFSDLNKTRSSAQVEVQGAQRAYSSDWPKPASKSTKFLSGTQVMSSTAISGASTAEQLESLFRSNGMTNQQIEEWITANFGIRVVVGKESLKKYLAKVLNRADLGLSNRILAAAQKLVSGSAQDNSDIRDYWDELDKRKFVS